MRGAARWSAAVALVGGLILGPATAAAGRFGGFGKDGARYLIDGTKICVPVEGAAPRCAAAAADAIAGGGFDAGTLERGADARVRATASGTALRVTGPDGAELARWDAGVAIASIEAVHRARDGRRVAIEYAVRQGGRTQGEVVVLAIATASTSTGPTPGRAAPAIAPEPTLAPAERTKLDAALRAAGKHIAAKRWAKAEASARAALALDPTSPDARYALAVSQIRRGQRREAIEALAAIGPAGRAATPARLLDAREAAHFAGLRADPAFRLAVGLDRDPARPPTAYERVLGVGGRWEQAAVACKQPEVGLVLERARLRFTLTIRQRCQGDDDPVRLGGRFEVREPATLALIFPNPDAADEALACALAPCADGGGEDCLACALDDLSFTLRVVRR
jgi:hypothetical protein